MRYQHIDLALIRDRLLRVVQLLRHLRLPFQADYLSQLDPKTPGQVTIIAALRFRFAPPQAGNGEGRHHVLTFCPDHSDGAEQLSFRKFQK
ncbi:MAG: hypothetical protein O9277_15885 [Magnetospirillum sp.]|nr:hypothetical protein [Magnetospirillum sp.]